MSIPPLASRPYTSVTNDFLEASLLVVIRFDAQRVSDLPDLFDPAFSELHRAAKAGLFTPSGPAVAVYYGDPSGIFDLELGFPALTAPTASIVTPAGEIHASALPAGPAAIVSHTGDYSGLGDAWARLSHEAVGDPRGIWIEAYLSDPRATDDAEHRTDLILPLRTS